MSYQKVVTNFINQTRVLDSIHLSGKSGTMAAEVPDPVPAVYLADDPAHRPGDPAPVRLLAHDPAPDLVKALNHKFVNLVENNHLYFGSNFFFIF